MADRNIQYSVASQYRASLAMLHQAIELCPETLWREAEYTHFYLHPAEADFRPWAGHRPDSANQVIELQRTAEALENPLQQGGADLGRGRPAGGA